MTNSAEAKEPDNSVSPETAKAAASVPVAEAKAAKAATPPKAADNPVPAPIAKPAPRHVYGGGSKDDVLFSSVRNAQGAKYPSKSLTVKHVQRRLAELGFHEAAADIDGSLGLLTERSIAQWQEANKLTQGGGLTSDQFASLFEGDPNVNVVLD